MTDETVLAHCVNCGGSIDPDAPYVHRDGEFLHQACGEPTCLVETCQSRAVSDWLGLCVRHAGKYPGTLAKAAADPFDYALRLVTGEVVYFYECRLYDDWVYVAAQDGDLRRSWHGETDFPIKAERGLDIRLEHIVWCADAPFGS